MNTLNEILNLEPDQFETCWPQIDDIISRIRSSGEQVKAWEKIVNRLGSAPISKGHPYFRLAVLRLQTDADESAAITYLELAYGEDQKYGPNVGKEPHRMGAYRLLSLTKGFLTYLRKQENWQTEQLKEPHRLVLIRTLLAVYDGSLVHILDRTGHTYPSFFTLINHRGLLRFAIENYYCAESLLEVYFAQNRFIAGHTGEYPLARAIVGLLAGVLEAILADRLSNVGSKTLGGLISEASKGGAFKLDALPPELRSRRPRGEPNRVFHRHECRHRMQDSTRLGRQRDASSWTTPKQCRQQYHLNSGLASHL